MVKGIGKKNTCRLWDAKSTCLFLSFFFSMEFIGNFRVAWCPCQGPKIASLFARGPIILGSGDDLNIPERDRSSVGGCSSAVEHGSPKPERNMNLSR